ncbi:SBBP repeat-containing protein [Leptospira abararensis]|uniref:SBBP repeat-containing protein n=1 Tax=Leptospira abararensis TaxID=2810036 RepID=UPI001E2B3277|nr:SBBP repeat-containing protein [Leptospira abararensis]
MRIRFWLFFMILTAWQCKVLSLNNPADVRSEAFWETELLRCILGETDCFEIPQDNQGLKEWTRLLGQVGSVQTFSSTAATDRFGNTYISGTTIGSIGGQPKVSPGLNNDLFVAKYDSNGNLLWVRQMGSTIASSSFVEQMHIDVFGDIYIVGSSAGPFNELSAVGAGSILIKLSSSGTVIWTRIFPTGSETLGYGVTSDGEGNVYITGNTEETNINGEVAAGGRNTILFKYNRFGDYVWTRLIDNGGASSYGQQVQYDPYSKNIFLVGQVGAAATFLGNTLPGGSTDSYLVSFHTSGVAQWVRFLGVSGASTSIKSISVDKKGSIYVTGSTNSNLDGQIKAGTTVQVLVKYSVTGDKLWTRLLGAGGATDTTGNGIYADNASHVYIVGNTNGNLGGSTLNGLQDVYLSKYDAEGSLVWARMSGVSGSTTDGRGISSNKYGTLYITGSTDGSIDGQTKQGTFDAYIMKYN